MRARDPTGFALLAALWALVLVAGLAGAYLAEAGHVVRVSANRTAELHAEQAALAGLERAHNVLERLHALTLMGDRRVTPEIRARLTRVWNGLDTAFAPVAKQCLESACFELEVRDLGTTVNVNRAGEDRLRRLFRALGAEHREADVAAQSIADWIDADELHRARGAESDAYLAIGLFYVPRNGPIAGLAELRRVHGLGQGLLARASPHLAVDGDDRVNINAAPEAVLATLPGVGPEAARLVMNARRRGYLFRNPFEMAMLLPAHSRAALRERYTEFVRLVGFEPMEFQVLSTGRDPESGITVRFRAVYVRAGDRVIRVKRVRL